jgi:hypothetical protein
MWPPLSIARHIWRPVIAHVCPEAISRRRAAVYNRLCGGFPLSHLARRSYLVFVVHTGRPLLQGEGRRCRPCGR